MINLLSKFSDLTNKPFNKIRELKGSYSYDNFRINILHTQGSPGAHPASIAEIEINKKDAAFPDFSKSNFNHEDAFSDFVLRRFSSGIKLFARQNWGHEGSGSFHTISFGQKMIERNCLIFEPDRFKFRFIVSFPSTQRGGGNFDASASEVMFSQELPQIVNYALIYSSYTKQAQKQLYTHIKTAYIQKQIRRFINTNGLVCFLANGSLLPRQSGIDDKPLVSDAVIPFVSPPNLQITIPLENGDRITGMGIPEGITIITGGGFHGKSTLLQAITQGVYNHIPDDGRQYVITRNDAVFVRSEEGRSIQGVNISRFIKDLPGGSKTGFFSTGNASGSTSQAANIMEALESGSRLFLFDEDNCATNFMLRDNLIEKIVPPSREPIKPLYNSIRSLWTDTRISAVLVIGGLGVFLKKADTVLSLDDYHIRDVTAKVRNYFGPLESDSMHSEAPLNVNSRRVLSDNFNPLYYNERLKKSIAVRVKTVRQNFRRLEYGNDRIDMDSCPQLVEDAQTEALGAMILALHKKTLGTGNNSMRIVDAVDYIEKLVDDKGLDSLPYNYKGLLSRPRRQEIFTAINRLRSLNVED